MKPSEILKEAEAREELLRRGYTRTKCKFCDGTGRWIFENPLEVIQCGCDGGYIWEAPITK